MYLRKPKPAAVVIRVIALCLPLILLLALVVQTAAAKTYTITDGELVFTYTTSETNPAQILDEAGLQLTENDTFTTGTDAEGTSITVRRSQTVTVDHMGEITQITTYGETVGQLLARLNIILEPVDEITHELNEETSDGMNLVIRRIVTREETYAAALEFDTTWCYDAALGEGQTRVVTEGAEGEVLCTAQVTYINGAETERTVLSQTVTRPATDAVIAVGTAGEDGEEPPADAPVIGDGYILLPTGEMLTYTDTAQVRATAYTHTDAGCDLITATGSTVHIGTVAVDPRYIPYGTRMFIVANDGSYVYGVSEAEDCGGAIKGDRVDLYFPTYEECMQFGWRKCTIYFLG